MYDYIKPKYGDSAKLCYMDNDSFVIHFITEDSYKGITNDIEKWSDTSNYDENKTGKRPLPVSKNKKVIDLFKDELGEDIMTEFSGIRAKTYSYLLDNYNDDDDDDYLCKNKKSKGTKKCVIKRRLMFENYTGSLFNNRIILQSQKRFKNDYHKVYTEEVNKITLSNNDYKRL